MSVPMLSLFMITITINNVHLVVGDFHIGFSINSYDNPDNVLSDGTCCAGTCAAGTCRTTLRLCFRGAGHSHNDVESSCYSVINRLDANFFVVTAENEPQIPLFYPREFQIYIRVSHSPNENTSLADFDPPFTDPLIDDVFIEADVTAVPYTSFNLMTETYTVPGDFGKARLSMSINVRCAQNYIGTGCEMLCDSTGTNCVTVLTPGNGTSATTATSLEPNTSTTETTAIMMETDMTTFQLATATTVEPEMTTNLTVVRRRMPRERTPGFIIGIAIACVLIVAGVVAIVVTIVCVAACVYRKQRGDKLQKIGEDNMLEHNQLYSEAAIEEKSIPSLSQDPSRDQDEPNGHIETDSIYEDMDGVGENISTEANSAYNTANHFKDLAAEDTYATVT